MSKHLDTLSVSAAARTLRAVLPAVGCSTVASYYFGYWFSH